MKILCWNTDEAVWNHWNKVVDSTISLVRVRSFEEVNVALSKPQDAFKYCFIYLEDKLFSENVERVVSLRQAYPEQTVIVFPNQASQAAALRLFSVGVSGQCSPYIGQEQLKLVLSVVSSGEIWGGKAFIQSLISQSARVALSGEGYSLDKEGLLDDTNSLDEMENLSERERSVAQFISNGLSNKQIALKMEITERTVKAHLTTIFKKTHTKDRLSLALLVQNTARLVH